MSEEKEKKEFKTIITLIRHGESGFGENYTSIEHLTNCRLTSVGINQSKQLNFHFDILILSPVKRTMETYINSKIKANKIIINELFREKDDVCPDF